MVGNIEKAADELKRGNFVIIYDGEKREGEADLIFHASFADAKKIERLRKDAGGLICLALGKEEAGKLGLKFQTELLRNGGLDRIACEKTAYGDEPSFAVSVNHKGVFTGISDDDRSLTIRVLEKVLRSENPYENFIHNFYAPGHIFLLISRGLESRRGHTELAAELARRADLSGAVVICEMLGSGLALDKDDAREYAKKNWIPFIEGKDFFEV